jgi:(R,R)-butanediol dehydrogenase / meso-butanediol dehydrogenase / diacetyl reductase
VKAAVYRGPREVRIESIAEPGPPERGELVIEVARAAICGTDASEWAHGPALARPPVVLGHEFVGRVVALGADVAGLRTGDRVACGSGVSCGRCEWCRAGRTNLCASYRTIGLSCDGGLAQYVAAPAAICLSVPDSLSDDAAATAQPLAVALHAVRRSGVERGQSCAVIGAGGIGAFIVAAAAARGASPLIALDIDAERLATASRLGADVVIDVRGRDIADAIRSATAGDGAHVVIESSGHAHAPAAALAGARRGGRVLLVGLQAAAREIDLFELTVREVDLVTTVAHVCDVDLPEALSLLASTAIAETVIDRVIALDDLVERGLRPLADGQARGKIVVAP